MAVDLGLGERRWDRVVADTQSLTRPGQAGRAFVSLNMNGETVDAISAPDNDFSDL